MYSIAIRVTSEFTITIDVVITATIIIIGDNCIAIQCDLNYKHGKETKLQSHQQN